MPVNSVRHLPFSQSGPHSVHAFSQDRRRVKGGATVHPALRNIEVFDQCNAKTAFDSMKFSFYPPNPLGKHTTVT